MASSTHALGSHSANKASSSVTSSADSAVSSQTSAPIFRHNNGQQLPENQMSSSKYGSKLKTMPHGKKTKGRVKIKMEFIDNKLRRYTTFSKRKAGLMKKAYELSTLTGTEVMLLVASETGHVYTFATRKLQPMITSDAGRALIQTCLNLPDSGSSSDPNAPNQLENHIEFEESEIGNDDLDEEYIDDGDDSNEAGSSYIDANGSVNGMGEYQYATDLGHNSTAYSDNGFSGVCDPSGVRGYDPEE